MTRREGWNLAVVTVSDRCSRGEQPDGSGDLLVRRLRSLPARVTLRLTVPDEVAAVRDAVTRATEAADLVILTGGTGLSPRDVTPQAVRPLLEYEVPGMAEAMRLKGMSSTPHAMLSRQLVGVRGRSLVLALPGGTAAVGDCLDAVWEALPHALGLVGGSTEPHPPPAPA